MRCTMDDRAIRPPDPRALAAQALAWIDAETEGLGAPLRPTGSFPRDPDDPGRVGRTFTRDDNPTFAQPEALLNAFERGADLVVHSASKYLNGHADVVAGAAVVGRGRERALATAEFLNGPLRWSRRSVPGFAAIRATPSRRAGCMAGSGPCSRFGRAGAGRPPSSWRNRCG